MDWGHRAYEKVAWIVGYRSKAAWEVSSGRCEVGREEYRKLVGFVGKRFRI